MPGTETVGWWHVFREVLRLEVRLLARHAKLRVAAVGLLFVPAVYAFIYLWSMWDPAAHTRELPAAIVDLDAGARYRERELNLGRDLREAIERQGAFAWRRYDDAERARLDVRSGRLAFVLEVPRDFSRRALPGERPGDARLTIYASEGNNSSSAGFARRFAAEVAQRVNTQLAEARWELVLSTAAGSQRSLETLRGALADLHAGAGEMSQGLRRERDGHAQLTAGGKDAAEAAQRLRGVALQLADAASGMAVAVRQAAPTLRSIERSRGSDGDLEALRQSSRVLAEGQRELARGLEQLHGGAVALQESIAQWRGAAEGVPLVGARLAEAVQPLAEGTRELGGGLERARDVQSRLVQGVSRLEDGVGSLADGMQRAVQAAGQLSSRLPDEQRLEGFVDGARELARGQDTLATALSQLASGARGLHAGLERLGDGAARLETGMELLRNALPQAVDAPGGSAQGLAVSVQPVVEIVAPVPNNGSALVPNFVPLALWVGAVMAAFLVHWRRVTQSLAAAPRSALALGKLALPMAAVLAQALLMLLLLVAVLKVPLAHPGVVAVTLVATSFTFLAIVFALVRVLGDLGKVFAVLLLVVQVSAAGAILPVELSDEIFQAMHPYLPLSWVVQALRVGLFDAYDGAWEPALAVVVASGTVALLIGSAFGSWRAVPPEQLRPPLDLD